MGRARLKPAVVRAGPLAALPVLALLGGCHSPIEGTWLFSFDRDADLEGSCEDPADYTGDERTWVDIYRERDGGVWVLLVEALQGTFNGRKLEAVYTTPIEEGGTTGEYTIEGVYDEGVLVGTFVQDVAEASGYTCRTEYAFQAERIVSPDERYPP